jgi:hypothetical protein
MMAVHVVAYSIVLVIVLMQSRLPSTVKGMMMTWTRTTRKKTRRTVAHALISGFVHDGMLQAAYSTTTTMMMMMKMTTTMSMSQ